MSTPPPQAPSPIARFLRRASVPVILLWLAVTAIVNVAAPQLEKVGKESSVSLASKDAPSYQAMKMQGKLFAQFDSDSMLMILIESDRPLDESARRYYQELIGRLQQDNQHVEHVQDFWGDRITAAAAQSMDRQAAYAQVNVVGDQGTTEGNESVAAVKKVVAELPAPPGIRAYVTGQAALTADLVEAGDKGMQKMTFVTFGVIMIMLLLIYRSFTTMLVILVMVNIELGAARGIVAVLAHYHVIGLSTFAVNMLTSLTIAAGTDYAIFLVGRYQEARSMGVQRIEAFYISYRSVSHVILASGLTIAGATYCLSLTRLPYLQSLGSPCATGMLVVVGAALTLGPAILLAATRFGLLEPRRKHSIRRWRRIGTSIVRWPGPILAATVAVCLIGLIVLPTYSVSYNDRDYIPANMPSVQGYQASDKHFSKARMNPDILLVEANQDLRTPSNMLVLDKIARNVFRTKGIAKVQSITRPLGAPIDHSSVPFQVSMSSVSITENMSYLKDRMGDMLKMTGDLGSMIAVMERLYQLMTQMRDTTHNMTADMHELQKTLTQIRDSVADFDDQFRPLRNYFYWESHCFDIPMCWAGRSLFDTIDGIDKTTENVASAVSHLDQLDALMPETVNQLPPIIAVAKNMRGTLLSIYSTFNGMLTQIDRMTDTATAMGQAFDQAKNDDFFYLPPEAFDNEDFKKGLKLMLSPNGHAAQLIITHEGDPAGAKALANTAAELEAARDSLKGTPLEGSKVRLAGTAATYHDIGQFVKYDLMIAVTASLCLIFIIMLIITRSLIAAAVIVGTIAVSLGSSFGLSVLIWQHLFGIDLYWFVLPFTLVILLAVGSDYNLLLVSRFKEELHGGLNTAIIRGVAGSGKVVTAAGLVFAFTMGSMITSDLVALGQSGTAICLGLLFDTLIVRAFMTPAIAALLGRWFWWPMKVQRHARRSPVQRISTGRADLGSD